VTLTEADLETYKNLQKSWREESHGEIAVATARLKNIFDDAAKGWPLEKSNVGRAIGGDQAKLHAWLTDMATEAWKQGQRNEGTNEDDVIMSDVERLGNAELTNDVENGGVEPMPHMESEGVQKTTTAIDPTHLLPDQRRAYDIVDWHLQETLANRQPPQLLMIIPGEGGVGKSETLQTITENFVARRVAHTLMKCAYTGIAASTIKGQTIHAIAMIPINGGRQSTKTLKKLEEMWADIKYLAIDEMSMVSKELLAKLSKIISRAKGASNLRDPEQPFGDVNVILLGDFHQFPPVITHKTAPLYWPSNPLEDSEEALVGRQIYEAFKIVVQLKEQVRVTDPVWNDLLQHVRYGNCRQTHLDVLRNLIITSPNCPQTDYTIPPWNDAILITPRHTVRRHWNSASLMRECQQRKNQLFLCAAEDTINGRPLTLKERFMAAETISKQGKNRNEKGGLPDVVELLVGMKIMVMFNVETKLDVTNGARGEVVDVVLDEREEEIEQESSILNLKFPPCYILVRLLHSRMPKLAGLPDGVIPITPMKKNYTFKDSKGEKVTVIRRQLPVTPAYALTDYRGQGQTLCPVFIDIGRPPSGELTPFNVYVALSRARGREHVRLIRDFDDSLFTRHPSERLRVEDKRLQELDMATKIWWQKKKGE
jgi:hypothetical protein